MRWLRKSSSLLLAQQPLQKIWCVVMSMCSHALIALNLAVDLVPTDSPMYPAPLTHRQASYSGESDGGLFGARGGPTASAYSSNGGGNYYHQQIQAHTANSRQQILSDSAVAVAYSQQVGEGGVREKSERGRQPSRDKSFMHASPQKGRGGGDMMRRRRCVGCGGGPQMWRCACGDGAGGSNLHSYGGGQLDLSVSTGNRSFQHQQSQQGAANSPYRADSGQSRFTYEEQPEQPVYYNANPRSGGGSSVSAVGLPPPLGMYEQNYRNCYQNNPASMTAAAVAAAYNYHYQQQQQNQIHQQQEAESPYDHHRTAQHPPSYDYVHNRYMF
ncbi:hypothetical protein ACTXT7_010536 [Hymenolepis weldensis]